MRNKILLGVLAASSLILSTAAYAESGGFTGQDRLQVYETTRQELSPFQSYERYEATGSIRAPRRNVEVKDQMAPVDRPDVANQ